MMRIGRKTALAFVLFVCGLWLLVSLGFWQISRGHEKASILTKLAENAVDYTDIHFLSAPYAVFEYKKVMLLGEWQPDKHFLLANRSNQGVVGYEVLMPFKTQGGQWLLINRGWVEHSSEAGLPPQGEGAVKGVLYRPEKGYTIGKSMVDMSIWPITSIYLDMEAFSRVAGLTFLPLVLVLDERAPSALTRIWSPVNSGPERHYGYAVQWFGLALVLLIFGIIWIRKSQAHR